MRRAVYFGQIVFGGGLAAVPLSLGPGCMVYLDLASVVPVFPVTTNGSGGSSIGFGVPPDPTLVGVQVALQVALFNTAGPLGVDVSNGVIATIGY